MKRKIYNELLKWKKDGTKPLMVLGARQVGKTYVIDKFCQNEFKNYIHLNLLENTEIIDLYNSNLNSEEKFRRLKILVNFDIEQENTILFIDEIQECESLIAELKFFCENYSHIKIICAGSLLGVKLKRFSKSFPVGKVTMINMYPLNFEEFLMAFNENMLIDEIKNCYENNQAIANPIHEKALNLFRLYLVSGGMPESINNLLEIDKDIINYNQNILKNIVEAYLNDMNKYVTNNSEKVKIEKTYKSIPSQLGNESNKFQYSKISSNAKSREYERVIDWLNASNMVLISHLVSAPLIPLKGYEEQENFKLFLNDIGILNNLLELNTKDIYLDNISLYKGIIIENYVATELVNNGFSLYYWQSKGKARIDFIINNSDGIIPIEVKASNNTQSKSLNVYIDKFKPNYAIRISTKNFGFDENKKIKSVPIYATFCIKK